MEEDFWEPGYEHLQKEFSNGIPNNKYLSLLQRKEEGPIYRYKDLVIKVRTRTIYGNWISTEAIKREARVGILINNHKIKHIIETVGYFQTNPISLPLYTPLKLDEIPEIIVPEEKEHKYAYIVVKFVKGEIIGYNPEPFLGYAKDICIAIIYILVNLQNIMNFTSYDLHNENIMFKKTETLKFYSCIIEDKIYSISIPFKLTIIDIGYSHVNGINSCYAETIIDNPGVTPGIYDPLFDFFTLHTFFNSIFTNTEYTVESESKIFIKKLNQLRKNNYEMPSFLDRSFKLQKTLCAGQKNWASSIRGFSTTEEVEKMFSYSVLGLYANQNKRISLKSDSLLKNAETYAKKISNNSDYTLIWDTYQKLFGRSLVNKKDIIINNYSDTNHSYALKLINIIENFLPEQSVKDTLPLIPRKKISEDSDEDIFVQNPIDKPTYKPRNEELSSSDEESIRKRKPEKKKISKKEDSEEDIPTPSKTTKRIGDISDKRRTITNRKSTRKTRDEDSD